MRPTGFSIGTIGRHKKPRLRAGFLFAYEPEWIGALRVANFSMPGFSILDIAPSMRWSAARILGRSTN
jgi:hypothetical protein